MREVFGEAIIAVWRNASKTTDRSESAGASGYRKNEGIKDSGFQLLEDCGRSEHYECSNKDGSW